MPDLSELLSRAERALEDGFAGRAAEPGGVSRARGLIRRRRAARQWGQTVGAVAAVGVIGAAAWLAAGLRQASAPALTPMPTDSSAAPSATAISTTTSTTAPTPTGRSTGAPGPTAGTAVAPAEAGCAAGGGGIPANADVHQVVDVDGDGRPDRAWLTADRVFGVTTASGATFSVAIDDASPIAASAVVQLVQRDLVPIALVDLGRDTRVYSLAGCAVTPVLDAQGGPYLFDGERLRGQGTGVGCTLVDGVLRLAGLDAVRNTDGTFDVSRTFVDLDADARHATNEKRVVVAKHAAADAPVVVTAGEVSCGELLSRDGLVEPMP